MRPTSEQIEVSKTCAHTKTVIWEPHLAGARKCTVCGMVYNPNKCPSWFFEGPTKQEIIDELQQALKEREDCIEMLADALVFDNEENREDALAKLADLKKRWVEK